MGDGAVARVGQGVQLPPQAHPLPRVRGPDWVISVGVALVGVGVASTLVFVALALKGRVTWTASIAAGGVTLIAGVALGVYHCRRAPQPHGPVIVNVHLRPQPPAHQPPLPPVPVTDIATFQEVVAGNCRDETLLKQIIQEYRSSRANGHPTFLTLPEGSSVQKVAEIIKRWRQFPVWFDGHYCEEAADQGLYHLSMLYLAVNNFSYLLVGSAFINAAAGKKSDEKDSTAQLRLRLMRALAALPNPPSPYYKGFSLAGAAAKGDLPVLSLLLNDALISRMWLIHASKAIGDNPTPDQQRARALLLARINQLPPSSAASSQQQDTLEAFLALYWGHGDALKAVQAVERALLLPYDHLTAAQLAIVYYHVGKTFAGVEGAPAALCARLKAAYHQKEATRA